MSVAFIERLLGDKMKSLIAAGGVTLPIMHFWEDKEEGEVLEDVVSKISIGINPRGYTDQMGWQAHFTGWISIESDAESPRILATEYGAMMAVVEEWQHAAAGASVASLNVEGFDVDDFQILTGGDAGYDPDRDIFYAVVNFELDGTLTSR